MRKMHDGVGVKIVMDTPCCCLWFYVWVWWNYFTIVSVKYIQFQHELQQSVTVRGRSVRVVAGRLTNQYPGQSSKILA